MNGPRPLLPPEELGNHFEFVRRLARGLVVDFNDAEDLAHETILVALERPLKTQTNVRGWLATIARNLAKRSHRTRGRRRRRELAVAQSATSPSTQDVAAKIELQKRVVAAVYSLREPYQSMIVYRYLDGRTPTEIAQSESISVRTVESRLYRALSELRDALDRAYDGKRHAWLPVVALWGLPSRETVRTSPAVTDSAWFRLGALGAAVFGVLGVGVAMWVSGGAEVERVADYGARTRTPGRDPTHAETVIAPPARDETDPATSGYEGRVVDEAGKGVPGARVRLVYLSTEVRGGSLVAPAAVLRRERERRRPFETVTGSDGQFSFKRTGGARHGVTVSAKGFAPAFVGSIRPGDESTITVREQNPVEIRVRETSGRPVERVTIQVVTLHLGGVARQVFAETVTDARGLARLPSAPSHRFRLSIVPLQAGLAYVEQSYLTDRGMIEIVLQEVRTRTVRAVSATSGAPIPDAYLIVASSAGRGAVYGQEIARRRLVANADGLIRYPVQREYSTCFVSAPGYELLPVRGAEVRLRHSMYINGVVRNSRGDEVVDAPLLLFRQRIFARALVGLPVVHGWSDPNGRFEVEVKLIGASHVSSSGASTLAALIPGSAPALLDGLDVRPGTRVSVELVGTESSRVSLEVHEVSGHPVSDATVSLTRRVKAREDEPRRYEAFLFALEHESLSTTDKEGHVEFDRLPAGEYLVCAGSLRRHFAIGAGEFRRIRVARGGGRSVYGRVLDGAGEPVPGLTVTLHGPSPGMTSTSADGAFRFDDLAPGPYSLSAKKDPIVAALRVPVALDSEAAIRLPSGPARLKLIVRGADEKSLEYAVTTERGLGIPQGSGFVKYDGRATRPMTPGAGVVLVRARGHGWRAVPYVAAANRTTSVRVEFESPGTVHGRVDVGLGGSARIRLVPKYDMSESTLMSRAVDRSLAPVKADAAGKFEFAKVGPGKYSATLWFLRDGRWLQDGSAPITVKSGVAALLRFRFEGER